MHDKLPYGCLSNRKFGYKIKEWDLDCSLPPDSLQMTGNVIGIF